MEQEVLTFDCQTPYFKSYQRTIFTKIANKIQPDYFFKPINQALLSYIQKKEGIDVILVFRGLQLFPSTIETLKQKCSLLVNYNPDHPLTFFSEGSGNHHITNSIPLYDVHVSYSQSIVQKIKQQYQLPAFQIPFGFDDNLIKQKARNNYAADFVFIGAYDSKRANILNQIKVDNFKIFGNTAWKKRTFFKKNIPQFYQGHGIYNAAYTTAIKTAKGTINLLRKQNLIENAHNMRTFEVPGFGGLLISQRTEEQESLFENEKEAVFWSSINELNDKLIFLNKHPAIIKKIKKAAFTRSQKGQYAYQYRVKDFHKQLLTYLN